ncbi:hypothetical protein [Kitasatospora sp. NPDC086791]|uniref:hypothetical protein n=1 Tax=Kitasatospora sp. NPDC086791 TaxID=3155178 RepID=UPI00341F8A85
MSADQPNTSLAALPHGGLPDQWLAAIHDRYAAAEGGHWHLDPEPHKDRDTVRTHIDGHPRQIGVLKFNAPYAEENRRFVLHAHDDMGALLAEVHRLRAVEKAAYEFADDLDDYCSRHGVSAQYAQEIRARLGNAGQRAGTCPGEHQ